VVRELVAPLNTGRDIDVFGGSPVSGARRFTLSASLGGQVQSDAAVIQDQFAPAQFFSMTDDEKLAAPSFEVMDSGLVFGDAVSFDPNEIVPAPLTYDTIILDDLAPPPSQLSGPRYGVRPEVLQTLAHSGAAARAATRRVGRERFANAAAGSAARVQPLSWVITPLGDGPPAPVDPRAKTWTELRAAVESLNAGQARWQMAPAYELVASS
jgi:hypothetical protein